MKMIEKKLLIEAIKDQQEIFGDLLFEKVDTSIEESMKKKNTVVKEISESKISVAVNLFLEDFQKAESLEELNSKICNCQNCALGKTRTKFVFGVGNPNADAMLIGEAPGRDEDLQGEPFVGRAGKLLNDILKAVNFKREDVYIANILKCRPPNNRDPLPLEMETCIPYLHKQIDLIQPKIILCLGRVAANGLLDKKLSLGQLRESNYEFNGIKVMATYHPAALLRNPNWKRGCWEDVQKFKKLYDELTAK
ncbi:MAG: uracil-DNA glycosylase [Ignavibacteriales bacterium]|nr:MAG: uracil-DNA glycosylase [Ignavibacteriales bacterium]